MSKYYYLFGLFIFLCFVAQAQETERIKKLEYVLDSLSGSIPGLNQKADMAFKEAPLHDLIRAIGQAHGINVFVDNKQNQLITYRFSEEPVKNTFLFLCKRYQLHIEPVGNILHFSVYTAPAPRPKPPREPAISYQRGQLAFDLRRDSLDKVFRTISMLTGATLIPSKEVGGLLTGYVPSSPMEVALKNMLLINGYQLEKDSLLASTYYIKPISKQPVSSPRPKRTPSRQPPKTQVDMKRAGGLISLNVQDAPLQDVIYRLFDESGENVFFYDKLEGRVTLRVKDYVYNDLLELLFQGTAYTYNQTGPTYVVGKRSRPNLGDIKVLKLKHRPTEEAFELIPRTLKEGVEFIEYTELNRFIVSGDPQQIQALESFLVGNRPTHSYG